MFKDLRSVLEKKDKIQDKIQDDISISISKNVNIDAQIACNILERLYWHVNRSLKTDRSSVKLNMFEKGIINSGLERIMPGTKDYLIGMNSSDIKLLLDDIEKELAKRKDTRKK